MSNLLRKQQQTAQSSLKKRCPSPAYERRIDEDTEEDDEDGAGVGAPEVGRLVLVMNCSLLLLLNQTGMVVRRTVPEPYSGQWSNFSSVYRKTV
jgi:hypothetical protein